MVYRNIMDGYQFHVLGNAYVINQNGNVTLNWQIMCLENYYWQSLVLWMKRLINILMLYHVALGIYSADYSGLTTCIHK